VRCRPRVQLVALLAADARGLISALHQGVHVFRGLMLERCVVTRRPDGSVRASGRNTVV
jgi:hypothetical protein